VAEVSGRVAKTVVDLITIITAGDINPFL
jgi:hypothetical protein